MGCIHFECASTLKLFDDDVSNSVWPHFTARRSQTLPNDIHSTAASVNSCHIEIGAEEQNDKSKRFRSQNVNFLVQMWCDCSRCECAFDAQQKYGNYMRQVNNDARINGLKMHKIDGLQRRELI